MSGADQSASPEEGLLAAIGMFFGVPSTGIVRGSNSVSGSSF